MAHEIHADDALVLHREKAWHGLGTIVQDAPTPSDALKIIDADYEIEQWAVSATDGESRKIAIPSHFANVRKDTGRMLGMVGKGYKVIQNRELAAFSEALAEQGDVVRVESAGTIRHGAKIWFLLKGESFSVRGGDEVKPYICVSNGHDGNTALRCTMTTIRVVCSNTLHMVIPRSGEMREGSATKLDKGLFIASHVGNLEEKVEQAKRALSLYGRSLESTREIITTLADKTVTTASMESFFVDAYTKAFGAIPANPKNKDEARLRDKAMVAAAGYRRRFDEESAKFGATAWVAMNAFSGWTQNDRDLRIKAVGKRDETRLGLKLFGDDLQRADDALALALTL